MSVSFKQNNPCCFIQIFLGNIFSMSKLHTLRRDSFEVGSCEKKESSDLMTRSNVMIRTEPLIMTRHMFLYSRVSHAVVKEFGIVSPLRPLISDKNKFFIKDEKTLVFFLLL